MLKQALVIGIVGLGMVISTPSMARPHHRPHYDTQHIQPVRHCVPGYRVNKRQAKQEHQINRGVQKGLIVKWEKHELKRQQHHIRKIERHMRSDGCLTLKESRRLMHHLDRASNRISQLTNNHIRRGHHRHDRPRRH